jgi:hypothetical protein
LDGERVQRQLERLALRVAVEVHPSLAVRENGDVARTELAALDFPFTLERDVVGAIAFQLADADLRRAAGLLLPPERHDGGVGEVGIPRPLPDRIVDDGEAGGRHRRVAAAPPGIDPERRRVVVLRRRDAHFARMRLIVLPHDRPAVLILERIAATGVRVDMHHRDGQERDHVPPASGRLFWRLPAATCPEGGGTGITATAAR